MAKTFTVTPSELRRKKEDLINKNGQLSNKISKLVELEAALNQQWDGEANDKFHAAFNTDKTKMDKFHTAIQNYCNKLEEIVKKYETTEQKVANIASQRTYH